MWAIADDKSPIGAMDLARDPLGFGFYFSQFVDHCCHCCQS
jgi:hypothetical protein